MNKIETENISSGWHGSIEYDFFFSVGKSNGSVVILT